jgi:predicted permease
MIARLTPGATLADAQAQIDVHNAGLEGDSLMAKRMAEAGFRSIVSSLHGDHVCSIRSTLVLVQAGAITLLIIGAVNLVNLLLIRASARAKEVSVRRALGASRAHVVREILVETTILTAGGGALGFAIGAFGIRLAAALGADRLPLGTQILLDWRLGVAALATALLLGLAFAVPIAWFHLRGQTAGALQSQGRGGATGHAAQRLRHSFIVGQIALAFVLLTGAGLLGLSLERAVAVSPGFRADRVLAGRISLPWSDYSTNLARLGLTEELMTAIRRQPGVSAVAVASNVPFSGNSGMSAAKVKGHVSEPAAAPRGRYSYGVDGDYFEALGYTLREGRFLTAADSRRLERVCLVDEAFAREHWPAGGALGQKLFQGPEEGPDEEAFTIVGVVGSVKQAGLTEVEEHGSIYYPYGYRSSNEIFVITRVGRRPASFASTLRSVVRETDGDLPVRDVRSMESLVSDSLIGLRTPTLLAGIFSAIAVLLTAIGTYGVLSYSVAQRRREIGVRMALGAQPGQIRSKFLSLALRLLGAGMALGLPAAWLTTRGMEARLFGVADAGGMILAAVAVVMTAVGLAACLGPSWRASRVAPGEALGEG